MTKTSPHPHRFCEHEETLFELIRCAILLAKTNQIETESELRVALRNLDRGFRPHQIDRVIRLLATGGTIELGKK